MPFQSTCVTCPAGYFCTIASTAYKPNVCPAGYYCPAGTTFNNQNPCNIGYYQPYTGQFECVPCDLGMYCGTTALTVPTGKCAAGYYCLGGSTSAQPILASMGGICPKGYYCPAGSAFPRPCTPGSYCSSQGLVAPTG